MRNPFKLPESAEQFLTIEDHLQMNKRFNKVLDYLVYAFLVSILSIFIVGSLYLSKSNECNQWHDKANGIQQADDILQQNMDLLKDSI